jgi:hypothetical protein
LNPPLPNTIIYTIGQKPLTSWNALTLYASIRGRRAGEIALLQTISAEQMHCIIFIDLPAWGCGVRSAAALAGIF